MGMVSFLVDYVDVLKLDYGVGCTTVDTFKKTELYTWNELILWYGNYISIKLLRRNKL